MVATVGAISADRQASDDGQAHREVVETQHGQQRDHATA